MIQSTNEYALKSSVSQLAGSVSRKIRELREKILYEIAFIESALDDPEHISLDGYSRAPFGSFGAYGRTGGAAFSLL